MDLLTMALLAIVGVIILLGIVFVFRVWKKRRENKHEHIDYRYILRMGIVWTAAGILGVIIALVSALPFYITLPLAALGLVYLVIGLTNRDKWR